MLQPRLTIVPVTLREANELVVAWHRHSAPVRGHLFAQAVADETGAVRGVTITGRPVARGLQDGWTAEVLRVATDGCPNACSALYGAAWRAARALGWLRLITYTHADEPGTSLRAAGWRVVGTVDGRSWDTPCRRRVDRRPHVDKLRWEAAA